MDIISDKTVTTRKRHRCVLCMRVFDKGIKMQAQTHTYDGIQSVHICLTCRELQKYIEPDDMNIWYEGAINESMEAENFTGTPEEYLELKHKNNT